MEHNKNRNILVTKEKELNIWSDREDQPYFVRALVPPPKSHLKCCPKCNSRNISGALIMKSADESDPNLVCLNCGYWWD
jgi:DNA-directed RNA polymerase subunit M/transcription elongation factor TFIIS